MFMKIPISVGRCVKRKTMLVWVKEYINKNFATCKSLCNLQELYTAFKEKHQNVNIGFSKFCALRPKWCVLVGSKMTHSVCVWIAHQNFVLLVDAMDWELTYKDLVKKIAYNPESNKCIMHRCEFCPGTATLKEFLDQELKEHEDDEKFNFFQWGTTDWAILDIGNICVSLRRIQREFDWCYWWFNKTFLYGKAKNYQFLIQDEI